MKVTGEAPQKGGESTPRCLPVTCQAVPFVCYCPAHGKEQKLFEGNKDGVDKDNEPDRGCSAEWGLRRWKRRGRLELFNQSVRVVGK